MNEHEVEDSRNIERTYRITQVKTSQLVNNMCSQRTSGSKTMPVHRPQGIRKQMKMLRKRHRVHIALDPIHTYTFS